MLRFSLNKTVLLLLSVLFAGACVFLSYSVQRKDFTILISLYTFLFFLYFILFNTTSHIKNIQLLVCVGIACRALLLFSTPNLSDDYFRFIWDGHLLHAGINPFDKLPADIPITAYSGLGLSDALFKRMNSPHYYTIYPPVLQAIFFISTYTKSVSAAIVIMKSFILLSEIGTIILMKRLLKHFNLPEKNILLYTLNPLVIIELCGNIHFEAIMLFFLLLSTWLFLRNLVLLSSLAFSLAVCTKLLPLMFLPFLFFSFNKKKFVFFLMGMVCFSGALFLPFLNTEFIQHIFSSIGLYFHNFEFNASFYYITRWIGYRITGYNIIALAGKFLSTISMILIIIISIKNRKNKNYFESFLFILTIYLFFTTTVHPWYIVSLVGFSIFTKYKYAFIWSCLIPLSYAAYQTIQYTENLWFVFIEYAIFFGFMLIEFNIIRIKNNNIEGLK
jgi:alpha-1,6-mannosyltransferase